MLSFFFLQTLPHSFSPVHNGYFNLVFSHYFVQFSKNISLFFLRCFCLTLDCFLVFHCLLRLFIRHFPDIALVLAFLWLLCQFYCTFLSLVCHIVLLSNKQHCPGITKSIIHEPTSSFSVSISFQMCEGQKLRRPRVPALFPRCLCAPLRSFWRRRI